MKSKYIYFICLVVFTALIFIIPSSFISLDFGNTILTVTAFLFGILAGFFIVVTTTDYNSIKNILATETAGWISLYKNILTSDKKMAKKLALLIDKYIIRAFDYEIIDYARFTHREFDDIDKLFEKMPAKIYSSNSFQVIRGNMDQIILARQQLTVLGARTMSLFQWIILVSLASIFILSLYGLRTGELFFDIVTVLVSSSIVTILFLIRDLDLYIWNEQTYSFDIFENVFKALGQLPYYPEESVQKGRIVPLDKKYRLGKYSDNPQSKTRIITIYKAD